MAVRISQSKFLSSTVAIQAALKDIDTPVKTPGGPLPSGIKNGVAKLTAIWFEDDGVGGESFKAEGEVVYPTVFDGQYIGGKKTKQWISYTADNLAERIEWIRDVIKNLGGGPAIFGDKKSLNFIKIVEFLDTATKSKPIYFSFATVAKEGNDWPKEYWNAAIPGFVAPTATPTTTDQKKTEPSRNGAVVVESASHNPSTVTAPVDDVYTDTDDLSTIISRAVNKDEAAIDKLSEFAKSLGYTDDDLDESESWEQVGGWVKGGKMKEADTGNVDTKPKREISENQIYTYEPPNKKDVTKRLKSRECRVSKVDNIREVATIYNLANKSEVYEVSFDDEHLK